MNTGHLNHLHKTNTTYLVCVCKWILHNQQSNEEFWIFLNTFLKTNICLWLKNYSRNIFFMSTDIYLLRWTWKKTFPLFSQFEVFFASNHCGSDNNYKIQELKTKPKKEGKIIIITLKPSLTQKLLKLFVWREIHEKLKYM